MSDEKKLTAYRCATCGKQVEALKGAFLSHWCPIAKKATELKNVKIVVEMKVQL